MKTFALIGHPVSHSLSPQLHNAVFQTMGLKEYEYVLRDTLSEEVEKAMNELREGKYQGYSVTIPHKQAVIPFCDELSERAKRVGAVNTVLRREDGKLFGENTDHVGFSKSLEEAVVKVGKALVLGSGGAARAVVAVLQDMGFEVVVGSRGKGNKETIGNNGAMVKKYEELNPEDNYSFIVNTTPVGMGKGEELLLKDDRWYRADRVYADVIYTPRVTPFLKRAEAAGAKIITGDRMFLFQAVEQTRMFTGRDVPIEVMQNILSG